VFSEKSVKTWFRIENEKQVTTPKVSTIAQDHENQNEAFLKIRRTWNPFLF